MSDRQRPSHQMRSGTGCISTVAVLRQEKQLIIGPGSIASQTIAVSGVGRPLVSLAGFTPVDCRIGAQGIIAKWR
jgi:hypothetical protein